MIQEFLERHILGIPLLGDLYRKRAAKLKRHFCLLLHRAGLLRPYSFVQWLVTNRCNGSCPFCEASSGKADVNELTHEEARTLLRDLKCMKVRRLVLSGGEPLMRPDICEIINYANSCGIDVGLVSNGWFIPEMKDALSGLRFFLYFTSLDGMPDYHNRVRGMDDAFARALEGLSFFSQMGVSVRIVNTVVHSGNISQLKSLAKMVRRSGATSWRLTPVCSVGRASGRNDYELSGEQLVHLASFIEEMRKGMSIDLGESHMYLGCFAKKYGGHPFFCGAGLTRCSIMPNGDVLGCHQVYDSSLSEGNVRDRRFPEIWENGFSRFRKKKFEDMCLRCAHLDGCQGGCWAEMQRTSACLKSSWECKGIME